MTSTLGSYNVPQALFNVLHIWSFLFYVKRIFDFQTLSLGHAGIALLLSSQQELFPVMEEKNEWKNFFTKILLLTLLSFCNLGFPLLWPLCIAGCTARRNVLQTEGLWVGMHYVFVVTYLLILVTFKKYWYQVDEQNCSDMNNQQVFQSGCRWLCDVYDFLFLAWE